MIDGPVVGGVEVGNAGSSVGDASMVGCLEGRFVTGRRTLLGTGVDTREGTRVVAWSGRVDGCSDNNGTAGVGV